VLRKMGQLFASKVFGAVAVVALPTVILAFLFGQTRIFFVMARDGMFPRKLGEVNPKSGVPVLVTILTAIAVAAIAAFLPLAEIAALANAGTLCAFVAVGVSMLVLRRKNPSIERPFRVPLAPLVGAVAILGCIGLFITLPTGTQVRFFVWNAAGLAIYFIWRRGRTVAA